MSGPSLASRSRSTRIPTLYGDFVIGNPVMVEGVIKEDGTWLATTIDLVTPEGYRFEFIGEVQSINPWIVSGVGFDTADWTEIDADIQVGDKVRVSGLVERRRHLDR